MFNRSIRDLLRKPDFENGDGNWIDVLPTRIKKLIEKNFQLK